MAEPVRFDRWPLGANNVAKPQRLPAGAVRELVNFDASEGGLLSLRPGFRKVAACAAGRGVYSVGSWIVYVDGVTVMAYNTFDDTTSELGPVANAPVAGAQLNGQLYLSTAMDSLRTDGATLKPWGVPPPGFGVESLSGGGLSGRYNIAVTALGVDGEESGADPVVVSAPAGSMLRITSEDSRPLRLYASVGNGATLFYQGLVYGGGVVLSTVRDDTERLTTARMVAMPHCTQLASHHGVLVGCRDNYVFVTSPMHPHLMDAVGGFFQYPAAVRVLAPTDNGVYIVADKTYFIVGLETSKPEQRTVLEFGAVEGTAVMLPDGSASWFTRYGQAIGDRLGKVSLVNRTSYAPDIAATGSAGLIDHGGSQSVVTTMRGAVRGNNLATGDYAELEIDDGQ